MKIRFPFAAVVLASALAACGDGGGDPGDTPPPLPAKPAATSKFATMKVAHILIGKDGKGNRQPKVTRTKAEALELTRSILGEIKAGRDFLEMAQTFSDDVDQNNKPNTNCGQPGVYAGTAVPGFDPKKGRIDGFVEEWKNAALSTPVGTVAPEPVASDYGYFLIKRLQ